MTVRTVGRDWDKARLPCGDILVREVAAAHESLAPEFLASVDEALELLDAARADWLAAQQSRDPKPARGCAACCGTRTPRIALESPSARGSTVPSTRRSPAPRWRHRLCARLARAAWHRMARETPDGHLTATRP